MPQIKTYEATEQLPSPNGAMAEAAGTNVLSGFAKGAQKLGSALQEHAAQTETSDLAAQSATLHAELTNEWLNIKRTADPNDHELASKFMEGAQERIDALGDNITSPVARQQFERTSANLKADFATRTLADQAQLAGEAAVQNSRTQTNAYASSVLADPESFGSVIVHDQESLRGMVQAGSLPQTKAIELHRENAAQYAQSAVFGYTRAGNFDAAREFLDSDKANAYLDGTQKASLLTHITEAEKAQQADARAAEAEQRRVAKDTAQQQSQKIVANMPVGDDGRLGVPPGAFQAALDIGDSETQRATLDFLRSVQTNAERPVPVRSDPYTYEALRKRIFDPAQSRANPVTQNELMSAVGAGKLDDKDFDFLRHGLAGDDDPATKQYYSDVDRVLTGFKASITDSSLIKVNQYGDQRYSEFQRDVSDFARVHRGDPNAADKVAAYARSVIPKYQRGFDENLNATIDRVNHPLAPLAPVAKGVTPRNKGESIADYNKRTGG